MKRLTVGAFAIAMLVATGVMAGDALKSGPQVGSKSIPPFNPLHCSGPGEGGKACLVWAAGNKPTAMVFAREVSGPLTSLVKKIDAVNQKQGKKMMSFAIFLSDKEGIEKELKDLATKEDLKQFVLAKDSPAGPKGYNVHKDADVTVVLYVGRNVKANHTFKKGELNAEAVERILADMPKILEKK